MDWARKFNMGKDTGIDLPGEVTGLLPTPDWKKKVKGESWFLGNTYHVAIGQGDLTVTPLQIALETALVANGGKLCIPHLKQMENGECKMLNIKTEHINLIKQGMIDACSPGGTAFPFFDFNEKQPDQRKVACKTGTAEIGDNSGNTHAWFTLFYSPKSSNTLDSVMSNQVVITVLLERGGSGAYDAAPVAKEIIERYEDRYQEPTPKPEG
jgi:penicillin-binding protein 2